MNILNKIKIWVSSLFYGLSSGENLIQGQTVENNDSKTIGIQQIKETNRVSHALLRGELTKEVKDLRYRDYKISENARRFNVIGESVIKLENPSLDIQIPLVFSGANHEVCQGLLESLSSQNQSSYTLKIEYNNSVRFLLEKYCSHFSVKKNEIELYFKVTPNKNIISNKSFCQYIQRIVNNFTTCEYSTLKKIWFVSYKIPTVPNFIKFEFNNLVLSKIEIDDNEFKFTYGFTYKEINDLTEKFKSQELEENYKNKVPKNLGEEDIKYNIESKCTICGKMITFQEGKFNENINGVFCCSDCLIKILKEKIENDNSR